MQDLRIRDLPQLLERERRRFLARHPHSARVAREARCHFPQGVPMHWMADWGTPHPIYVREASGAEIVDVDGNRFADFCLGDTGAMFGHSPPAIVRALHGRAQSGLVTMLPAEQTAEVGRLLAALFGLPFWQITQTASDANRAALRWARAIQGRPRVLVFDGCYHGTLDETLVRAGGGSSAVARRGLIGAPFDVASAVRVVPFNDTPALEQALAAGDVAALICEPVMTNIGMVLPRPGFLESARELTRRYGALLIVDETHTLSTGRGGYTRVHSLDPDLLVCGKAIAGGLPCAVLGFTAHVEQGMGAVLAARGGGHTGLGTTLAANALAIACLHASLTELMTEASYDTMLTRAARLEQGLRALFAARSLDWHVARVGARTEFGFGAPARDGAAAEAQMQPALEGLLHLMLLNRGVIVTPFHNMMLTSPATSDEAVERLLGALHEAVGDVLQ
jgi:glutamate-1-semialdehyde 2,1-aminomutase